MRHSLILGLTLAAAGMAGCSSSSSSPTPDTAAPAVNLVAQNRTADPLGFTVDVTFNEPVQQAIAETTGNYTFSGGINVVSATRQPGNSVVRLVTDAVAVPGDFTLTVSMNIQDIAGNTMTADAMNQAITTTDAVAPAATSIAGTTIEGAENDTIVVVFNDDMLEAEVEALANWNIESPIGTPFDPTGATVDYVPATRTATITLDAGATDQNLITSDDIAANFTTMRDVSGNTIAATTIGVDAVNATITGDLLPPTVVSAYADGAGNTVTFRFSEPCRFVDTADLISMVPTIGTRFQVTDASAVPSAPATGSIAITGTIGDGDQVTISDGITPVTFEFDYGGNGTVTLAGLPNDADAITISDGVTPVTFEFDNNASVAGGNVSVTIGGDADATIVNLIGAINGDGFNVTAYAGPTSDTAVLINDGVGTAGNVPINETDTSGNINFTGMANGGVGGGNTSIAATYQDAAANATALRVSILADPFNITPTPGGAADFTLANDTDGTAGNVAITEIDTNGTIDITGMSGGQDAVGMVLNDPTTAVNNDTGLGTTVTYSFVPLAGDTVEIYGVTDLAGNPLFPVAAQAIVAEDTNQPSLNTGNSVLTAVSGENNDTILVEFDRDMNSYGLLDPTKYTVNPGTPIDLSNADFAFNGTNQVTITLDSATAPSILFASTYDLSINNVETAQGVERTIADTEVGIAPMGDNVAPTVGVNDARLDPANADSLLIIFSEALNETAAETAASYTNAGNVATSATLISPRVVRATFGVNPLAGDALVIQAAAAADLAGNVPGAVINLTVAAADAAAPTVALTSGTAVSGDANDFIYVDFSEEVDLTSALNAGNYSISNGAAVDLTGASLSYDSVNSRVIIELASGIHLDPALALSTTTSNVTDVAGNAIVAAPVAGVVGGDTTAPSISASFANLRADATSLVYDVLFDEEVDPAVAGITGTWSASGGQTVTGVETISPSHYRITLNASLGAAETLTATGVDDYANNAAAPLVTNPLE